MNRTEALAFLKQSISNSKMVDHCLASEAVMRSLAIHLNEDPEIWGLAGLLHDIDVEITQADPKMHGPYARKLLEGKIPEEAIDAIAMHNEEATGKKRHTKFQHALAAGETITGLINATRLVYPDRKIASVQPKSISKRMKQKAFAASVKRENILECEEIGIPINEFVTLALNAMKSSVG